MKSIIILIASVMYCFTSLCQTTLNDKVSFKVPSGARKITKSEVVSESGKRFRKSDISTVNSKHFYKLNGLLISLWETKVLPDNKRPLEAMKKEMLELVKLDNSITVKEANIKSVNSLNYLILHYQKEDAYYYRFYSETKSDQLVSGLLQFKEADKKLADQALNDILKSIKFGK